MNKTNSIPFFGGLFLATVLVLLSTSVASANGPWQWSESLYDNLRGDAMYMPSAIAFDKEANRYYVVDTGNSRLVSFDREGKLLKAFSADGRLKSPFDMVRLDDGRLWVVEKGRNSLTLIDVAAKKVTPNTLTDDGRLVFPDRLAYDDGKLYVLDRASGQVLRLNDDLTIAQHFGCAECPGVIVDFVVDHGTVWTISAMDKEVSHYGSDGKVLQTISLGDKVDFPVSLALGPARATLYILDRHLHRVAVYGLDGSFQYDFLGLGKGDDQLYFPRQLRFDPWGNLCVVDEGNGRVEVFKR